MVHYWLNFDLSSGLNYLISGGDLILWDTIFLSVLKFNVVFVGWANINLSCRVGFKSVRVFWHEVGH